MDFFAEYGLGDCNDTLESEVCDDTLGDEVCDDALEDEVCDDTLDDTLGDDILPVLTYKEYTDHVEHQAVRLYENGKKELSMELIPGEGAFMMAKWKDGSLTETEFPIEFNDSVKKPAPKSKAKAKPKAKAKSILKKPAAAKKPRADVPGILDTSKKNWTSRKYHEARQKAKSEGKSIDEQKEAAQKASKKAGKDWEDAQVASEAD